MSVDREPIAPDETRADQAAAQVAAEAVAIKQAAYDLAQDLAAYLAHPTYEWAPSRQPIAHIFGQLCGWLGVIMCPECRGTGRQWWLECDKCGGDGQYTVKRGRHKGDTRRCDACQGSGERRKGTWPAPVPPWAAPGTEPVPYPGELPPVCDMCEGHRLVTDYNPLEVADGQSE